MRRAQGGSCARHSNPGAGARPGSTARPSRRKPTTAFATVLVVLTAVLIVVGYLLGSCPWGYWLVRVFEHRDIREVGSGNVGASNVWRSFGTRLGLPVLLLDCAKGFVPALLGVRLVSHPIGIACGAAAMAGHWRPLFLRFSRGGKVMATGGGAFFAVAPLVGATALGIWLVVFLVAGFASVASLVAAASLPIGAWLYGYPRSVIAFAGATTAVAIVLHRGNASRLLAGTEAQSRVALLSRLRSRSA